MIHIENEIDKENKEVYSFNTFDTKIVLVGYSTQTKPTNKRKWSIVDKWDVYSLRDSTLSEPILPEFIRYKAESEFIKTIHVMKWSEWKLKNK